MTDYTDLIERLDELEKRLLMRAKGSEAAPEYYEAEVCSRAAEALRQQQWVSAEERLPETAMRVQFYWVNALGNGRTSEGSYDPGFTYEEPNIEDYDDDCVDWKDETPYRKSGWYEEPWVSEYYYLVTGTVTHWRMPLPQPPTQED